MDKGLFIELGIRSKEHRGQQLAVAQGQQEGKVC